MELYVQPPGHLSGEGDITENWKRWRNDFFIYLKASNYVKKSIDVQAYLLKQHIGEFGQAAINKITFSHSKDTDNIHTLVEKLNSVFEPPKNELIERYNFFTRVKKRTETLENFIDDLKEKATTCNFGKITSSLIRDKVMAEIKDKNLRKILFEIENLDLLKLVSTYNRYMSMKKETNETSKKYITNDKNVERAVSTSTATSNTTTTIPAVATAAAATTTTTTINNNKKNTTKIKQNQQSSNADFKRKCWRCNQNHPIKACPAWGLKCKKCGEYNHYMMFCKSNTEKYTNNTNMHKTNISLSNLNIHPQTLDPVSNCGPYQRMEVLTGQSSSNPIMPLPSAPEYPISENVLYPNLNYVKDSNAWSWMKNGTIKSDEIFQNYERPMPTNAAVRQDWNTGDSQTTRNSTATTHVPQTDLNIKSKDDCKIS